MIVRMSKVEIVGEKDLLQDTIALVRELSIFQIEPATFGFVEEGREDDIRSFAPDENAMFERVFLENLRQKIIELFSYLPDKTVRTSYLEPRPIIDTIANTIERHVAAAKSLSEKRDALRKEKKDLDQYGVFLGTLAALIDNSKETPDIDFIGLTIREPGMVDRLREVISRITDWKFELMTDTAEDGTLVGLITVEKALSEKVKKSLSDEHVPELVFPAAFSALSFAEKSAYIRKRVAEVALELSRTDGKLAEVSQRWVPIYQRVREWIDDRLSLLSATAATFETRMCFFINGWMATANVETLRKRLVETFGSKVMLEEKEMREQDLERVPIILKNPPYFRPFELFTSLLPLPAYTSYDPTPFIGIFFPLFFGMILGDAGYGLLLCLLSMFLIKKKKDHPLIWNGAKILMTASLYSIFFGILYGEFFGDLPERLFHLKPLCIERREGMVSMIYFALAVGVAHIFLGLILGVITGFRKKDKKEAVYKLLTITVIVCMITILASFFEIFPTVLARPVIIVILVLTPFLFFTGGLLAPLELLKSIGNIISYVRIMAIGLTSVLLAFVANNLGGLTGDVVTGVAVAGLIHLLNIVLGVFSPTIHSLRLHYVEFFSKFIEHGGRRFEPLKK